MERRQAPTVTAPPRVVVDRPVTFNADVSITPIVGTRRNKAGNMEFFGKLAVLHRDEGDVHFVCTGPYDQYESVRQAIVKVCEAVLALVESTEGRDIPELSRISY